MIDSMFRAMTQAKNNATVEYAQAGLQAWTDAQTASTNEERDAYREKFKQCHRSMSKANFVNSKRR